MRPLVFLVLLSVLVVIGVMAYPYLMVSSSTLSKDQAVAFVLQDVQPLSAQGVEARVVAVGQIANASTQAHARWSVEVLLTKNAHSPCPAVDKRFYTLAPVAFRTEPILSSCSPTPSINYREEALIDSAAFEPGLGSGAYGCAFLSDALDSPDVQAYCPGADVAGLKAVAVGLPAQSWVVQWSDGGSTHLVALSSTGQLLRKG